MSDHSTIVDDIALVHDITDPEWKISGDYTRPDKERILLLVTELEKLLNQQEGDLAQVESGGIIMRRDGKHIDVFVHIGELDE